MGRGEGKDGGKCKQKGVAGPRLGHAGEDGVERDLDRYPDADRCFIDGGVAQQSRQAVVGVLRSGLQRAALIR